MSEIKKYQGKTVEAVQISEENLNEVAAWCDGKVVENRYAEDEGQHPLILLVRVGFGKGLSAPAEIGSWLVKNHQGIFKIFQDRAFGQVFELVNQEDSISYQFNRELSPSTEILDSKPVAAEKPEDAADDSPAITMVVLDPEAAQADEY